LPALQLSAAPSPVQAAGAGPDAALIALADEILAVNSETLRISMDMDDRRVPWADALFFYDPKLTPSGAPLHPTAQGHELMAAAIEPTLAALLGDRTHPVSR
jgi:hypothetical protein